MPVFDIDTGNLPATDMKVSDYILKMSTYFSKKSKWRACEMKKYQYEAFGKMLDVFLEKTQYMGGNLAIRLLSNGDYGLEPYGVITINLPELPLLDRDCAFVDENNFPDIGDWLVLNDIAEPTGRIAQSGFCHYPEFRFNVRKL